MKKQLDQVKEFHRLFDGYFQDKPTIEIPQKVRDLRLRILKEECQEVFEAMQNGNLEHISHELADLLYVLLGTVHVYGLSNIFEEIFDEVHASNLSKFSKNLKLREDGKILKSKDYKKPNIKKILTDYV